MTIETLDSAPTVTERRLAVIALKALRGKLAPLDKLIDAIPKRRIAHIVEEALRAEAAGRGLWRYSGQDRVLISAAILRLNSLGARTDGAP